MQTIGERLEEARKRKGISIREASEATKIRSDYLQKFESNSYELSLPDIYVRGFLRTYAQYLKLNTEKLLTDFASLGLGSPRDSREARRQDQREVFGRIDLPDPGKVEASPPPPQESTTPRNQPQQSRAVPTSVVTGAPSADRRQKFKTSYLVGGAVLALVLLVILLRAVLPSETVTHTAATQRPAATIPAENLIRLIAIDNVRVKVTQQSDKRVLFNDDLVKGETRDIERQGKVSVTYDIGKNLQVEIKGQRYNMTVDGYGRNALD
jgi:transcriptional regulator with XRE-family HTH domain